jgi:hypothetical protein
MLSFVRSYLSEAAGFANFYSLIEALQAFIRWFK